MSSSSVTIPKPEEYESKIPSLIFSIYKSLSSQVVIHPKGEISGRYKLDLDLFSDRDSAISILKRYMDKGAFVFSHFNQKFTHFIIFRDKDTDIYIDKLKKEKNAKKKS